MLQQKIVTDLEGEFQLWNPISPNDSVMGILLSMIPGWKIGNVDGALLTRRRTLSVKEKNLYALLTNDLADAYECLFIFDYDKFVIDIIDITRESKSTSIFMSHHNLIKNSNMKTLTERIVTALHVRGGNMDIAGVNPNGTDAIYNVDFFKDRMSSGLLEALTSYENLFQSLQPTYANLLTQFRVLNGQLATLNNNPPTYELSFNASANGTATINPVLNSASGLNQLEALRRALEGIRAVRIENGNVPYTDVNAIINQLEPMLTAKRDAVANLEVQITTTNNQLRDIVNQLRMEEHFTPEQWIELNEYFIFDTFQEDSLIWTDIMSNQERQDIQQELFELGARTLARASYPKFEISIDSVNFLALPEFKNFTDQFELGTTFTLDVGHYIVKPLLLEVFIDFEDPTNFKLVYANKHTLDNDFSEIDFISSNINATNSISFNLTKIEAMVKQNDDVTAFINGALETQHNEIVTNRFQTKYRMDETGIRLFSYDPITQRQLGYESWWTGRNLAFSNNNFTNSNLAIGVITAPGSVGGQVSGVIADAIVGRLIAGNELHVTNSGNNFRLDETGAWLDNANFTITRTQGGITNKIVLDPTEGFAIFRGDARQVHIGADGNVNFSGNIQGGSININNRFMVDSGGNVTITSGTIDLGSGQFTVDAVGRVTMRHGTFTGGEIRLGNTIITESGLTAWRAWLDETSLYLGALNGGQITLNTINANRLLANTITAREIGAHVITASHMAANAITADMIAAGTLRVGVVYAGNISADQINAGILRGIRIEAGNYYGLNGNGRIEVGGSNFGDFTVWGSGNNRVFRVWDGVGSADLSCYGNNFLRVGVGGVTAFNNWNFGGHVSVGSLNIGAVNVGNALNTHQLELAGLEEWCRNLENRVRALEA
jgi:hypothetical protein